MKLINSDNLEYLKTLPDNSVDSIVTDPPYGISFMGKKWDYDVPSVETWKECLRVLKHGGHILVACGTRTQHRMAVNIEDAGFEIRDIVAWIYGSGFPKSLNIGKAVDKLQGNEREEFNPGGRYNYSFQEGNSQFVSETATKSGKRMSILPTKGNSPYEGWGTALKPAMELWTMARKPLSEKNVASNVLKWGTGAINIDGSRVIGDKGNGNWKGQQKNGKSIFGNGGKEYQGNQSTLGRFPANVIHDGSDEVTDLFPNTKSGTGAIRKNAKGLFGLGGDNEKNVEYGDSGSASRFFYCAKASKSERNDGLDGFEEKENKYMATKNGTGETSKGMDRFTTLPKANFHPTVKPVALMRYLVKLITPIGGIVLDPFMGSGSTGVACRKEGFEFIGIELDSEYFKIAEARINNEQH